MVWMLVPAPDSFSNLARGLCSDGWRSHCRRGVLLVALWRPLPPLSVFQSGNGYVEERLGLNRPKATLVTFGALFRFRHQR